MIDFPIPVLGFAAYSGTGKTTLLEALLPKLTDAGLRIGVLKHAHHDFDIDQPGKDSYRLRKAGADQMLIASHKRFALITETPDNEAQFNDLLTRFDAKNLDLILVEGCKNIAFPKIELHRQCLNKPWLYPNDTNVIAVASEGDLPPQSRAIPHLNINDLDSIATFVVNFTHQHTKAFYPSNPAPLSKANGLSVEQGIGEILGAIAYPSQTEKCPLHALDLRVLAAEITSPTLGLGHSDTMPGETFTALKSGQRLATSEIALVASLGRTQCDVYPRLRVGVLSARDKIQPLGQHVQPDTIYDANRYALMSRLQRIGCLVDDLGILKEDHDSTTRILHQAATQCDMVISLGSVSASDDGYVMSALGTLGKIHFSRVNMKPEQAFAFGVIQNAPVFCLPGHPISALISFLTLVEPAIRKQQGERNWSPLKILATTADNLPSSLGLSEYFCGHFEYSNDGHLSVRLVDNQSPSSLHSMLNANCLIEMAPHIDSVKIGESVTIIPLQGRI